MSRRHSRDFTRAMHAKYCPEQQALLRESLGPRADGKKRREEKRALAKLRQARIAAEMKIIEDEIAAFFPSMSEERRRALACDDATCQAVLPLHNQQFTGLDQCCVAIATAVGTIVGAYMAIYGEEIAAGL